MLSRITGIFLLLLMTFVMALEHPVLNFCACLKSFSIGNCACAVVETPPAETDACCHDVAAELASLETPHCPPEECATTLNFDLGDFSNIYQYDKVDTVNHSDFESDLRSSSFLDLHLSHYDVLENPSRGSPELPPPLPIYKTVAVFLI